MSSKAATFGDFKFGATPEHFLGGERPVEDVKLIVVDTPNNRVIEDEFVNLGNYLRDDDVLAINDVGMGPSRLKGFHESGQPVDICFLMLKSPENSEYIWDVVVLSESEPPQSGRVDLANAIRGNFLGKTLDFDGPYWLEKDKYLGYRGTLEVEVSPEALYKEIDAADLLMHPWYTDLNNLPRAELNPFMTTRNTAVHVSEPARRISPAMYESFKRRGLVEARFSLSMCFSWQQTGENVALDTYRMNQEEFVVPESTADILNRAVREGRRIVSIGTSGARTLESLAFPAVPTSDRTDIFISPGFEFKYCSVLLTNLHNPMGTHVVMAGAFGGTELVVDACEKAAKANFRFGIHGDSMLVIGDFVPSAYR